jgi:CRISPR-associated protein Cas1
MARFRQSPPDDLWLTATSVSTLKTSWARVAANHGAAGGDGVSVDTFGIGVGQRLLRLSTMLRQGRWHPGPARAVDIPKKKGGKRRLMIPPVGDRVVAGALGAVLTPVLDPTFSESSFGYRPGRGVDDALTAVARWRDRGFVHVVEADIVSFFDNLRHDRLILRLETALAGLTGAERIVGMVALMLEAHAQETGIAGRGVPQGSPLSPLLANLGLDALDDAIEGRGVRLVRYADDFVILCKDVAGAEEALARAGKVLTEEGLELHSGGSRVRDFDRGFEFLGDLFVRSIQMRADDGPEEEATAALRQVAEEDARAEAEQETEARAGYDRGARVLYLTDPGRRLAVEGGGFAVMTGDGHRLAGIGPGRVGRIEIGPGNEADWDAMAEAASRGIPVAAVDAEGATRAIWAPPGDGRAGLHLAQAAAVLDPARGVAMGRALVDARLRNMRAQLFRLNRDRDDPEVIAALAALRRHGLKLDGFADIAALRGAEGHAASLYWPALGRLAEGAPQPLRRTRPATDPLNAAMNYLTGLLERDMAVAVAGAGLHPGFGFLHQARDGNLALVWDLMEPFRAPLTEGLAVFLFNARRLRPEMFTRGRTRVEMSPEARRAIILGYETAVARQVTAPGRGQRLAWRPLMRRQALDLAVALRTGGAFLPYVMEG